MIKYKGHHDRLFLKSFAWQTHHREFPSGGVAVGNEAMLLSLKDGQASMATYDVNNVWKETFDDETFWWAYEPLLTQTPTEVALHLRSCMRTWIRPKTPEVAKLVELAIESPSESPDMPKPTPTQTKALAAATMCVDKMRRSCVAWLDKDKVTYIPLEEHGLEVEQLPRIKFDERYRPLQGYPVERAAALYVGYSQHLGGTKEAMALLAKLTTTTQKEIDMATAKKDANTVKKDKVAKAAPAAENALKAPKEKTAKEPKVKVPSAANRFRELIMEGKLTDEKIFEKVQKEFNLDDSKKGYVKWYRNDMVKKGEKNVPSPK